MVEHVRRTLTVAGSIFARAGIHRCRISGPHEMCTSSRGTFNASSLASESVAAIQTREAEESHQRLSYKVVVDMEVCEAIARVEIMLWIISY